jgi:hypothetical protein
MRTILFVSVLVACTATTRTPPPMERRLPTAGVDEHVHGSVTLASNGIGEVGADEIGPLQTLHVRMTIANDRDNLAWALDTSAVEVTIADWHVRPLFVNAESGTLPIVRIDRGQHRVVDLYFPTHPELFDAAAFDVSWHIATPSRPLEGKARFVRDFLPRPGDVTGIARWWWCDDGHAWPMFRHESGPLVPRPPVHVRVTEQPRGSFHELDDVEG